MKFQRVYFEQIIGQKEVKKNLIRTVKDGHVSHALLFSGADGTGSLPLAVAFAGYIFCEKPGVTDRCGNCSACLKMNALTHPDLHFSFPIVKTKKIDHAKVMMREFLAFFSKNPYMNLKAWEVEIAGDNKKSLITTRESDEIVKSLSLKSFSGGHKVMIIWHPEKMNNKAANKILKTLEEPSPKTVVILVAPNSEDLMPTIISRAQLIKCDQINDVAMTAALEARLGLEYDDAMRIARLANGDFYQATLLAEAKEASSSFLNLFSTYMRGCAVRDYKAVMDACTQLAALSRDQQQSFIEYALEFIHQSVIFEYVGRESARFDAESLKFAERFAPFIAQSNLGGFNDVLSRAHYLVQRNVNAHLLFLKTGGDMMKLFKTR